MITLKSNEFWGARSGVESPKHGNIIKLKKWGNGTMNSSTPGRKKRREKTYANKRIRAKNFNMNLY